MNNINKKQEETTQEEFIDIPTEIMGDYQYSNQSAIKPMNRWWEKSSYKLKFLIPAVTYVLFYGAFLYLEFIF